MGFMQGLQASLFRAFIRSKVEHEGLLCSSCWGLQFLGRRILYIYGPKGTTEVVRGKVQGEALGGLGAFLLSTLGICGYPVYLLGTCFFGQPLSRQALGVEGWKQGKKEDGIRVLHNHQK